MSSFSFFKKNLPRLLAASLWISLLSGFFVVKAMYHVSYLDIVKSLYVLLTQSTFGPLLFVLAYVVRGIFFFPATLLSILAGTLFGFTKGFILSFIGAMLSGSLSYVIGGFFSKKSSVSLPWLKSFEAEVHENAFLSVFILRLLHLSFDLVSYVCGLVEVGYRPFLLASAIAFFIDSTGIIALGSTIQNIDHFSWHAIRFNPLELTLSIFLIVLSLVIAVMVHRYHKKKRNHL